MEPTFRQKVLKKLNVNESNFSFDLERSSFVAALRKQNIVVLNLMAGFTREGKEGGLFLINDSHYNRKGNQLAASEISRVLSEARHLGVMPSEAGID